MNKHPVLNENKDILLNTAKLGLTFIGSGVAAIIATPIAALGVSVIASAVALTAAVSTIVLSPRVRKNISHKIHDNNIAEVKSFGTESERQQAVEAENSASKFKNGGSMLLARQVLGLSVMAAASIITNGGIGVIAGVGTMYLLRDKKYIEHTEHEKKISELAKEIRARRSESVSSTAKIKL